METKRIVKYRNENFPFMTARRILSKAGAKKVRVRKEAVEELIRTLEGMGLIIAKESIVIAHGSPHPPSFKERETITAEDVAIATHRILSQDL